MGSSLCGCTFRLWLIFCMINTIFAMQVLRKGQPDGAEVGDGKKQLDLFFSQSLEGFFFMMLDEPVRWDEGVDKEAVLDYVFDHQRMTRVNDAMLEQYGAQREEFLGLTTKDFYRHNLAYGRRVWRDFFDAGRLHIETEERRVDGTPLWVEGDYICLYDNQGRITGHFGIQRDVTSRKNSDEALRRYNHRLMVLRETDHDILAARSAEEIAQATLRRMATLIPCAQASVALFDAVAGTATMLAVEPVLSTHATMDTPVVPLAGFLGLEDLRQGRARVVPDLDEQQAMSWAGILGREGARSCVSVPLQAAAGLMGSLNAWSDTPAVFTPEHVEIAEQFASHLAVAIQQARLRTQVERHAASLEERVQVRTRELESSENRLRSIVQALPDLVFVVDDEGRYVEILTAQEHLLYRPVETLKGQRIHDVFPREEADQFLGLIGRTLETGKTEVLEYALEVPAGERWFEARTAVIEVPGRIRNCVALVARDITDRKRAEELETQIVYLKEELKSDRNWGDMVGASPSMQAVFKSIEMVAGTDSMVLLLGETGTGKELIARAVHSLSQRQNAVLMKVNCGALPSGLVESELFGHERGAFTGATQQKKGRFELAHRGTLFLDEVGELPPEAQVKLLRVLQEQEFERVGGAQTIRVDVRVIAATNRDLHQEVKEGRFRADLFYRLNIFPIQVPPLRERRGDIPQLTQHFMKEFSRRMGRMVERISQKALDRLVNYDWPGNVRELANVIERAVILSEGEVLHPMHICLAPAPPVTSNGFLTLEEMERQHILKALGRTHGVLAGPKGAARILGVNRSTLWSRMKKLGISGELA
jgi:formate hydrogenlyase transcriptional activator